MKSKRYFITHLCTVIFLLHLIGCNSANKTARISENNSITKSKQVRTLKAGEIHHYNINLAAGEFVHIKVNQSGIDVLVKVFAVNGELENVFDSPTGELGAEDIYLLSNVGGKYEIEIYPAQKYADAGEYDIRTMRLVKASKADKKWMAALAATQNADKLRSKSETRQQSIQQYESALSLWIQLKDDQQYALTTRSLGFVYVREKNYEKAIELFNQLLLLWNKLGDVRSEGFTYLIIGRIHDLQKNYSKSLEYNLNSIDSWKKAKDNDQESFVLMNIGNLYAHLNDKQKAIDYFEQSLKKNEQSVRPSIKAVILRDYASAMLSVGEKQKAMQLYEQSVDQWKTTANQPEEARTAIMLAAFYLENNDKEKAKQYYQEALGIWKKLDDQKEIKNVQAALGNL